MSIARQQVTISLNSLNRTFVVTPVDPLVICPLDSSHRMKNSKLECHLERCLIGDLLEMKCPWNPLHIVDESSYHYHVVICEDKAMPALQKMTPEN